MLAFWLAAVLASRVRGPWEETTLAYSAVAAGLCSLPTVAVLLWAQWAARQAPDQQLLMVLAGTSVRMFTVLLGAGILYNTDFGGERYFQKNPGFWLWILGFYMISLGLEVTLILMHRPAADQRALDRH
jgi:hypothetical protein